MPGLNDQSLHQNRGGSLAFYLQLGRDLTNMGLVIGIMGVIVAVGLIFDRLVFGPLESWVQNRWGLSSH